METQTTNGAAVRAIELQPIKLAKIMVEIEGITPLICHRFAEKFRTQIREKQMGTRTESKKKKIRKPEEEFNGGRYLFIDPETGEEKDGFPVVGIKAAMIEAGYQFLDRTKVSSRYDVMINGIGDTHRQEVIEIHSPPPVMREDVVRLSGQGRTADLRYRPEYSPWSMSVPITFMPDRIKEEAIVGMLAHAGFSIGLGEWRPEKDGVNGRFQVVGVS